MLSWLLGGVRCVAVTIRAANGAECLDEFAVLMGPLAGLRGAQSLGLPRDVAHRKNADQNYPARPPLAGGESVAPASARQLTQYCHLDYKR